MKYSTREMVVFAGSTLAIIASIFNIASGADGTGLWVSVFVIIMFAIVIAATLRKEE
jgi:FtsH-binding integral membrane protein